MSGINDEKEGLGLPKCHLTDFFDDVEGKLALMTGLVDYKSFGLKLEDVRRPLLVVGLPGIGKTCGIISSIKELNKKLPAEKQLGFKKILLGQTVVGSMQGIPVVQQDGNVIRVQIPDLPDPKRDGEYGVLFLDEITTADEMQIQPALGLCDDSRNIGEYTLPPHWVVIAAGNGPDCTNFVRLDDMTISRFSQVYDVAYNYFSDFRPYAHASGLDPDIIAFLNFSPDTCVRVESSDMDSAGKLFPCPRTWEHLSTELKIKKALGKEVDYDNMENFAGRIVGINAGREFGAFMQYKKRLTYDVDRIIEGTEREPEIGMATETFHIILQALIKKINDILNSTGDGHGNYPLESYQKTANAIRWLLSFNESDKVVNAVIEIRDEVQRIREVIYDDDFLELCPEFNKFFEEYAALLLQNRAQLDSMRF